MSIKELEREVKLHNRLYFVEHKPVISDYEFDQLVEQLKQRSPESKVLSEIGSDLAAPSKKVRHELPMLSLDKCYDNESITSWGEKFEGDVVASPKIDGCAVSLKYDGEGRLFLAATRGSGSVGEEITKNVGFIKDIPQKIKMKNVEVRGEAYMPLSVFDRYKAEFANPRNLAAGAIKQKDPHKTGEYTLSFWAYDLIGEESKTEVQKRELLKKSGFPVVEWKLIEKSGMQEAFDKFLAARDVYDFETDGVVFKVNSVAEQERLGITGHHPRYAIAYKFQGDSGVTKLVDVEWSVARTGVITPVGIVEPVELSGATVTRASLHNVGLMEKLGVSVGAEVMMMRRGGVIPNLESVLKPGKVKVEIPKKCPSCGGPVERRDDFLFCVHPKTCVQAKIGELKHFVQTVEIDGFGDVLLEKLYENGFVTDASEFFTLSKDDLITLERMGDTLADKLIRNIEARRELPLDVFLRCLGIREVGKHASTILARDFGTLEKVRLATEEELSAIHTIGEVIAREIVEGLKEKKSLIDKMLKFVKITLPKVVAASSGPLSSKSFLFTGSMLAMERKAAEKLVESMGGSVASGVSKTLDFLVVGDGGGAGSKLTKAEKLASAGEKIKIISENDFLKMVKVEK